MDALLDAQFQRVEAALEKLIDSITTYNPSVPAAEQLLQANNSLTDGLETLTQHQQNHARILSLRQTAHALDAQVKGGLAQLADARRELAAAALTAPPPDSRDVPIDELIAYAQRISRYTVPPTYRPPLPLPLTRRERVVPVGAAAEDAAAAKLANGTPAASSAQPGASPAAAAAATAAADSADPTAPSPVAAAEAMAGVTGPAAPAENEDRGTGWAHLSEEQRAWLDSISRLQYVPWPSDNDVKSGALARIQAMQEQGMDPAAMTKSKAELEEEAARREEQERRELEELRERQRRGSAAGRRPSLGKGGAAGGGAAAAFGLDLYDPDEG